MPSSVTVKRAYDEADVADGTRILIDGLWPRGITKTEWPEGSWRPTLAPSRELREWYRHDVDLFDEFAERYRAELDGNDGLKDLLAITGPLTLVTATKDVEHSHAAVLRDYLRGSPL